MVNPMITDFESGTWLNPPPDWSVDADGTLHAMSGDKTDFWQETHYGFRRDDGHALLHDVAGGFTAVLTVDGDYEELYDQAGMMLRADPGAWIKFGIEKTDGVAHLSVVATYEGRSDWSAQPVVLDGPVSLRATRMGDAMLFQWSQDGGRTWAMVRLASVPKTDGLRVGPYLCSPERAGFAARFSAFTVQDPVIQGLHE